jgi:hypothetical protein
MRVELAQRICVALAPLRVESRHGHGVWYCDCEPGFVVFNTSQGADVYAGPSPRRLCRRGLAAFCRWALSGWRGLSTMPGPVIRAAVSNSRNRSGVRPASRAIPPIVYALTGLCRGIVTILWPSVITTCFPWRAIRNPTFSSTRTASRCLTPGIRGIGYPIRPREHRRR